MRATGYRALRLGVCAVFSLVVLTGAGCSLPVVPPDDDGSADKTRTALQGGVAGFDLGTLLAESYWYSRYDLGSLVMKSGLGETFMPDMAMVGAMVDLVSDAQSTAVPPANAALLKRVFNAGNPAWMNPGDGDPMDFGDERWALASDTSTSAAAAGWTLIKEIQWARMFHVDSHFGSPGVDDGLPGAQQRFGGLVLFVEAVMQGAEWINNPSAFDTSDPAGAYVMLMALSDLGQVTAATAFAHSDSNRNRTVAGMMAPAMGMADADALAEWFLTEADGLFETLETPTDVENLALAIQSLTWYSSVRATNRDAAKARITEYADVLLSQPGTTVVEHAQAIRGLLDAYRLTGDEAYLVAANEGLDALLSDFDWTYGVFASQSTYTADEVAWFHGALSALRAIGDPTRFADALELSEHFFEAVVNMSGMQISAPPIEAIPGYERLSEISHRYPTTPVPPAAGGEHGIAPVFAASVTWDADTKTWTADRSHYDTAGAMHLSNEMLWSFGPVNGFPVIP